MAFLAYQIIIWDEDIKIVNFTSYRDTIETLKYESGREVVFLVFLWRIPCLSYLVSYLFMAHTIFAYGFS